MCTAGRRDVRKWGSGTARRTHAFVTDGDASRAQTVAEQKIYLWQHGEWERDAARRRS